MNHFQTSNLPQRQHARRWIRRFCALPDKGQSLMRVAGGQLNMSARVYHHILKLVWTIADLAESEDIQSAHPTEALQYRPMLMMAK